MATTEAIRDGMNRYLEQIKDISKEQDWPELLAMVMDQVFDGIETETEANKLFNNEAYLHRLCIRYETFKKSPFNVVSMCDRLGSPAFRIANYDYKTFLWAKKVYPDEIDNNFIYLPYGKLKEKQIKALKEKALNNYAE